MHENSATMEILDGSFTPGGRRRARGELSQAQVDQVLKPLMEKWKLRLQVGLGFMQGFIYVYLILNMLFSFCSFMCRWSMCSPC